MKLYKSLMLAGTALGATVVATAAPMLAQAQSTATQAVEEATEVVITGRRTIGPTRRERGTKAKTTVTQDYLSIAPAGQTFADSLNLVPGYNFTNNDAYGSSGGEIMMRGLDSARVSLTVDALQINDSGNYAIYTNQMIDSELLCQASVQTGATDIDSISASATGGTINVVSCNPETKAGGVVKFSMGQSDHRYGFVKLDSGTFGPWNTRAYVAYTGSHTDTWTIEPIDDLRLQKNQYNAMVYQPVGEQGSFISMAAHWNENRNHFIGSQSKAQIDSRGYGASTNGLASVNPSDTGNVRIKSKWVINDRLTLTVDPSFQYVLALGGSTGTVNEAKRPATGGGFIYDANTNALLGSRYAELDGWDINGDGVLGAVSVYRPNITHTQRYSLQSGLIYQLSDAHLLRFNAAFDRARHRQTGQITLTDANGAPINLFAGKYDHDLRIPTADGNILRRRDRLSYADVDVLSVEYVGRFLEDKLFVSLGLREQTLKRDLNQNCYSELGTNASSSPVCTTQNIVTTADTTSPDIKVVTLEGAGTRRFITPYSRTVEFSKTLPNLGVSWRFDHGGQVFATYAESLSSPRTDALYDVLLSDTNDVVTRNPEPETSETIEIGYRLSLSDFNGTITLFSATDQNRLVEAFVQDTADDFGYSSFTNVGEVRRNGVEISANYQPIEALVLSGSVTFTDSELQADIYNGFTGVDRRLLPTKGKALTGMPEWMGTFGLSYQITPRLNLNLNGKYVGDRFYTFVNDEVADNYTLINMALRYDLPQVARGTYLQLNIHNLFDQKYLHGTGYQNNAVEFTDNTGAVVRPSTVFYQQGAPRTTSVTLRTKF